MYAYAMFVLITVVVEKREESRRCSKFDTVPCQSGEGLSTHTLVLALAQSTMVVSLNKVSGIG